MAARLATLGALGAEGTVPCWEKRPLAVSCRSVLVMRNGSLEDTKTQIESLFHMLPYVFSPSRLCHKILSKGARERCFYRMDFRLFFVILSRYRDELPLWGAS